MNLSRYFADVSSNNGEVWIPGYSSSGLYSIAIKATEGTTYVNPAYATLAHQAHEHGLSVFHYHFARPENGNPVGQVEHFLHNVEPHFVRPGDFIVFDVETGSPREAVQWVSGADHYARGHGYHAKLYTYLSFLRSGGVRISSNDYWVAAWGNVRPVLPRGMNLWAWQYTDGHTPSRIGPMHFGGIHGNSDGSILSRAVARHLRKHRASR